MASRILEPINNEADRAPLQAELARHKTDTEYRDAHRAEWLLQYPDQWVMVHNGELVAVAPTLSEGFEAVERLGIPKAKPVRAHLSTKRQRALPKKAVLPNKCVGCPKSGYTSFIGVRASSCALLRFIFGVRNTIHCKVPQELRPGPDTRYEKVVAGAGAGHI